VNLAWVAAVLFVLLASAGLAAAERPHQPLPIGELVSLSNSAATSEEVIQRVKGAATTYALRGSDFAKLKAAGVPDAVLDYLQQSLIDHLDLLTRYWTLGGGLGGCSFCYPQPVDLAAMRSGYPSVSSTPPTRYMASKPPGTPDWVPYPPSRLGGTRLSVSQIVELANNGTSQEQLIQRIRGAYLEHVIGSAAPPAAIRSHPIAGLSGAQLARLNAQGVPEAVLDALQGQFLAAFIEAQRLHYLNWGKGSKR